MRTSTPARCTGVEVDAAQMHVRVAVALMLQYPHSPAFRIGPIHPLPELVQVPLDQPRISLVPLQILKWVGERQEGRRTVPSAG